MKRQASHSLNSRSKAANLLEEEGGDTMSRSASRLWLVIIAVLFICIAVFHSRVAPIGGTGFQNAPDEQAHLVNVQVIAHGKLPTLSAPTAHLQLNGPAYEWHQPPLYYALAACFLPLGVYGVRLLSTIIGMISLGIVYRTVRLLSPSSRKSALLATAFAGLIPGHCAILSVINNDGLLELFCSGVLYLAIRGVIKRFDLTLAVQLGATLGLGLLTKASASILVLIVFAALFLAWRSGQLPSKLLRYGVAVFGVAAVISGWWFVRNVVLYGEPLPVAAFGRAFEGTAKASDILSGATGLQVGGWVGYAVLVARWTYQSFFAVYGLQSMHDGDTGQPRFLPAQIYQLMALIVVGTGVGMLRVHNSRKMEYGCRQIYGMWLLFLMIALVFGSFAVFAAKYFQAQGRYLYPAMLPISSMVGIGWRKAFAPRYSDLASGVLVLLMLSTCVAFLRYVVQ